MVVRGGSFGRARVYDAGGRLQHRYADGTSIDVSPAQPLRVGFPPHRPNAFGAEPPAGGRAWIAESLSSPTMRNVYFDLTSEFNRSGTIALLTSGQAVVHDAVVALAERWLPPLPLSEDAEERGPS